MEKNIILVLSFFLTLFVGFTHYFWRKSRNYDLLTSILFTPSIEPTLKMIIRNWNRLKPQVHELAVNQLRKSIQGVLDGMITNKDISTDHLLRYLHMLGHYATTESPVRSTIRVALLGFFRQGVIRINVIKKINQEHQLKSHEEKTEILKPFFMDDKSSRFILEELFLVTSFPEFIFLLNEH